MLAHLLAAAVAQDSLWQNPLGGQWTNAANWSPSPPNATTSAYFDLPESFTVAAASLGCNPVSAVPEPSSLLLALLGLAILGFASTRR